MFDKISRNLKRCCFETSAARICKKGVETAKYLDITSYQSIFKNSRSILTQESCEPLDINYTVFVFGWIEEDSHGNIENMRITNNHVTAESGALLSK